MNSEHYIEKLTKKQVHNFPWPYGFLHHGSDKAMNWATIEKIEEGLCKERKVLIWLVGATLNGILLSLYEIKIKITFPSHSNVDTYQF